MVSGSQQDIFGGEYPEIDRPDKLLSHAGWYGEIEPGDLLVIPAGVYHDIESMPGTFTLSCALRDKRAKC